MIQNTQDLIAVIVIFIITGSVLWYYLGGDISEDIEEDDYNEE